MFVVAVPDGTQKRQVSDGGGFLPRWGRLQREIFYLTEAYNASQPPGLMAKQVQSGAVLGFGPEEPLFSLPLTRMFEPDPEGLRFHTFLPRPASRASSIKILMNWTAELEQP